MKSETPDNFDEGLTMVAATLRQHRQDGTASFVLRARDELAAKEHDLAEARAEFARAERTIKRMAAAECTGTVRTIAEIHRQGVFERTGNPEPWKTDNDAEWDNPLPETLRTDDKYGKCA